MLLKRLLELFDAVRDLLEYLEAYGHIGDDLGEQRLATLKSAYEALTKD